MKIAIECVSCRGTGLYSGFAEHKGTAVICLGCSGQGWTQIQYNEFTGRKKKPGITKISHSAGSLLITGVGATGTSMTYDEFEHQVPAQLPRN